MKTVRQRIEFGKGRRNSASRASQADPGLKRRSFDPIKLLLSSATERVQELLPIKYQRMSESPFAFFRGSIAIMAADLALTPNSGIEVQLCGDAHVRNMGSFASPDGKLIFDINDFDETIRGPWEWDIKRMAASIVLAGLEAGQKRADCSSAVEALAKVYCGLMAEFAHKPVLEVTRHIIHRGGNSGPVHAALQQSERTKPLGLLSKYTKRMRGKPQFIDERGKIWRVKGREAQQVLASLDSYRRVLSPERRHLFSLFSPVDVGFKVVGTGSVGLRDYVVLLEGNGPEDPLFLQIKQEAKSAYARYIRAPRSPNQGQRVAEAQRAIQPSSDPLLGWTRFGGHDYLVRQLNDRRGEIDMATLKGKGLESLALMAAELLARGHARSGDSCMIFGYCGNGSKIAASIRDFASAYADQVKADYDQFMAAIKNKKIAVSN